MRILFAALALMFAAGGAAHAQPAPAYTEEQLAMAREVVAMSGAEAAVDEMLDSMTPLMAEQIVSSGAPRELANRFVEIFREEFRADLPRLLEMISVGYAGALTLEELRDVRDFYASPSGRALVGSMTEINATMVRVGEVMGRELGERALVRLQAEQASPAHNP